MTKPNERFEDIISQLEKIVTELDSSLGLEDSLKKFEEGMALAQKAEVRLATLENQFQKIQQTFAKPLTAPAEDPSFPIETVNDTIEA